MITFRHANFVRVMLVVNVALFTFGFVHYVWIVEAQGAHDRNNGENNDARETRLRSLLENETPKPCLCNYQIEEGKLKKVDNVEVEKPWNKTEGVVRNKIGQDFNTGQEYQVPNIVHYIWFNTAPRQLEFVHMLSVLSAHKFLEPDVIYFHTDIPPIGEYWERVKALPKLKIMKRDPPRELFGEKVMEPKFYTSHSNVDRVKILMEYGGIYLDFDSLVTRSMDELRRHVCTIGYESDEKACGSAIVCSKDSFFLYLWLNAYLDDYRMDEWAYNTGKVPWKLSKRYPHLVHVEERMLNRPNFHELEYIWGEKTWPWQENYAVHTWYRLWKDRSPYFHGEDANPDNVKTWNNTFGQIARTILYGKPDILPVD